MSLLAVGSVDAGYTRTNCMSILHSTEYTEYKAGYKSRNVCLFTILSTYYLVLCNITPYDVLRIYAECRVRIELEQATLANNLTKKQQI